ncbi:MAG: hypothetical protein U1F76_04415 [Candidatus Competibacteraceae bacterium]
MQAIHRIERIIGRQLILNLPASLEGKQVEVIVRELTSESEAPLMHGRRRSPPPALAGKMVLNDDLIAPAVPETEWEAY